MQQIGDSSVNSLARDRASIMLQSVRGGLLALPEVEEAKGDK
jgi:hypothetical protein